ncbi:Aminomethyltransferase [Sinobacterium norvegicum]|uniref:Aminomethyltransferase n=1 Tax=Sinobacterium norvegicum TaxID=1641715 RepID=A0ABN8EJ07_9GAMM|nr:aminomethyltransferase family protein [Sinobacterium norvegicum]CAH0992356.1 Aminomethyltransferase [Sinobacterium norvegicum]
MTEQIDLPLQGTPFFQRQQALCLVNEWSEWNGYRVPSYYYDDHLEYAASRNAAAVFDGSPMSKYQIIGADAEAMLNRMVTRDVCKQGVNRVAYNVFCDDNGRVIEDGTLFRLAEDRFQFYCQAPLMDWLQLASVGFDDLAISDISDTQALLALQGPTSCAILQAMGLEGIDQLKPFDIREWPYQDGTLRVSRTGFTGDLGYELFIAPEFALALWDHLFSVGKLYGIQPMGEQSLDTARIEAGFILPDIDFHSASHTVRKGYDQSPYELGLGWMVNLKKPHFSGKQALLAEHTNGSARKLLKLDIAGNKPAVDSILYRDKKCSKEIGYITSTAWSSILKTNMGYGFIEAQYSDGPIYAEIYYQHELRWHRRVALCTVKDKPFWGPARARQTPPPSYLDPALTSL